MSDDKQLSDIEAGTRAVFVFVEIMVGAITCYALADLLFSLHQGYEWRDVFRGLGIMAAGAVLYLICRQIFGFVRQNY